MNACVNLGEIEDAYDKFVAVVEREKIRASYDMREEIANVNTDKEQEEAEAWGDTQADTCS